MKNEIGEFFIGFIIVLIIIVSYTCFFVKPVVRKNAYKEAVEKQYFEYDNKIYKVELYDELTKPEIPEKEE